MTRIFEHGQGFFFICRGKKRQNRDKTETKQKTMVNKTKLDLKIVHEKKSNSIKGSLITYGLRTSSGSKRPAQNPPNPPKSLFREIWGVYHVRTKSSLGGS
jgi:hypothetical protein